MRVEGKNAVTHMRMDKPKLNKYASKASTDVNHFDYYIILIFYFVFVYIIYKL